MNWVGPGVCLVICFAAQAGALNFLSMGDWGSVTPQQAGVASQMGVYASSFNASFVLALGDNFYDDGVANDTDPQWQSTYQNVFTAKSLQVPWYSILGNHDHNWLRGQGEIDYYKNKRDKRWIMPWYWYNQVVKLGDGSTAEILFIDTVILAFAHSEQLLRARVAASGSASSSAATLLLAEFEQNKARMQTELWQQMKWINDTLAASTADWIFVAGHYPVYSAGEHGNTLELDLMLLPVLKKYHVDAYFCGHDHTLQHLASEDIQYFVSGNGAGRGGHVASTPQLVFGTIEAGFMLHQLSKDQLTTRFIDMNGNEIYNTTQTRRPKTRGLSIAEAA
jgi:acid phosphatase